MGDEGSDRGGCRRLSDTDSSAAFRKTLEAGPAIVAARVRRTILAACPELGPDNWLLTHLGTLVFSGQFPEAEVDQAVAKFRKYGRKPNVGDPVAYLVVIFRNCIRRRGLTWPGSPES
jgi:hypothetical protein